MHGTGRAPLAALVMAVAVSVSLAPGCSSSSTGGGGDVPVDRLQEETVDTLCDLLFRCGSGNSDTIRIRLLFGSPATCRARLLRFREDRGLIADLERLIESSAVSYDAAAARRCLEETAASCSGLVGSSPFDACHAVFGGTVPEGSTCWRSEECLGDAYCNHANLTIPACPGTCRARIPLGSPCEYDIQCQRAGLEGAPACARDGTGTAHCVEVRWEPDAAVGEPCGFLGSDPSVVTLRACGGGTWCTSGTGAEGVCREPIPAGGACTSGDDGCVDGYFCTGTTCNAVTIARTEGEACGEGILTICDPVERLECDGATCIRVGDGAEGSACTGGELGEVSCNAGLRCYRDTMTCGPPKPTDASCEAHDECASGDCARDTAVCRERICG